MLFFPYFEGGPFGVGVIVFILFLLAGALVWRRQTTLVEEKKKNMKKKAAEEKKKHDLEKEKQNTPKEEEEETYEALHESKKKEDAKLHQEKAKNEKKALVDKKKKQQALTDAMHAGDGGPDPEPQSPEEGSEDGTGEVDAEEDHRSGAAGEDAENGGDRIACARKPGLWYDGQLQCNCGLALKVYSKTTLFE